MASKISKADDNLGRNGFRDVLHHAESTRYTVYKHKIYSVYIVASTKFIHGLFSTRIVFPKLNDSILDSDLGT